MRMSKALARADKWYFSKTVSVMYVLVILMQVKREGLVDVQGNALPLI